MARRRASSARAVVGLAAGAVAAVAWVVACAGPATETPAVPVVVVVPPPEPVVSAAPATAPASASAAAPAPKPAVAELGAPCTSSTGDYACTADQTTRLQCRGGTYQLASTCRGPLACVGTSGKAVCDDSIGEVGDACVYDITGSDNYACSVARDRELVCNSNGVLEISNQCRGLAACRVTDNKIFCDQSRGRLGERCRPADNHTCTEDRLQELQCSPQGLWIKERSCPKRFCEIINHQIQCG